MRLSALLLLAAAGAVCAEPASHRPICGELSRTGDVPVLRVWGTAAERGYAHGYLLAGEIKGLFESFLADQRFSGGVKQYTTMNRPMAESMMAIRPLYRRELEGIVAGYRDRLGDKAMIAGLDRPLEYGDVLAINCLSDRGGGPMCSSFAVWGALSFDGGTLTARNLDWPRLTWLIGADVVLVELPSSKPKRAGWVSLSWPGIIGCLSGMNASGVTVAMHDVPVGAPEGLVGFTPRGFALREALEKTGGPSAIEQVAELFRRRHIAVGTNIFVSEPWDSAAARAAAAVMEYDSRTSDGQGVTPREPTAPATGRGGEFVACTNHFRQRGERADGGATCSRYQTLMSALLGAEKEDRKLDVEAVWQIAASVNVSGIGREMFTYHTIVFEPNKRRMHFATASEAESAGRRKPVTVKLDDLLGEPSHSSAKAAR